MSTVDTHVPMCPMWTGPVQLINLEYTLCSRRTSDEPFSGVLNSQKRQVLGFVEDAAHHVGRYGLVDLLRVRKV